MKSALLALAVLSFTAASVVVSSATIPAAAEQARQPDPGIDIVSVSGPASATGTFEVTFRVIGAADDRAVRIAIHDHLVTRPQIQASIEQEPATDVATILGPVPLDDLALDDGLYRIELRPDEQAPLLTAGSVHPIQLALERSGRIEDTIVLFALVPPDTVANALSVAVVAPIAAPPMLTPAGETIVDPVTRRELEATVDALVATQGVPATVRATPETLVGLLQAGDVRSVDLVNRLQLSLSGREVLTSPFVRINTEAWLQSDHTSEFAEQVAVGTAAIRAALGTEATSGTWLSQPPISPETLTALGALGLADRIVVPNAIVSPLRADLAVPASGQRFELLDSNGVGHAAMAADDALDAHFDRSGDAALDAHHLLVELGWIAMEAPDVARGVIVDPPEGWVPNTELLTNVLRGLDTPLLTPTTVTELFAQTSPLTLAADPDGDVLQRTLIAVDPIGELPLERERAGAQSAVVSLDNLNSPSGTTEFLRRLLLTSASADLDTAAQRTYLSAITERIDRSRDAITAVGADRITLSSRNGPVPISIRNDGTEPVRALVTLASDKLEFPEGSTTVLTLAPGVTELQAEVRARTSGDATLDVIITSPDRGIELDRSRVIVRSTALSGVGLVIAAVASGFLLLWWLRNRRSSDPNVESDTGVHKATLDESTHAGDAGQLVPRTRPASFASPMRSEP